MHAQSDQPRRLVPQRAFPPYAYVSGRFPHPTSDPAGHSYGLSGDRPAPLDPGQTAGSIEFLWACDLFNHGYYWEAHEAWEGLWHTHGRQGTTADGLKGLIKLAAAGVKAREHNRDGVCRHAARAVELFEAVRRSTASDHFQGLSLADLVAHARRLMADPASSLPADESSQVVFDFCLLPEVVADDPRG